MEASELVHVARYALQLFGTLQGQEIYQKQHIDVDTKPPIVGGARARCAGASASPHARINKAVGPPKCTSSQLTWYRPEREYSACIAAFGSTSFTGRRTLLHRRASGYWPPLSVEVAEAHA